MAKRKNSLTAGGVSVPFTADTSQVQQAAAQTKRIVADLNKLEAKPRISIQAPTDLGAGAASQVRGANVAQALEKSLAVYQRRLERDRVNNQVRFRLQEQGLDPNRVLGLDKQEREFRKFLADEKRRAVPGQQPAPGPGGLRNAATALAGRLGISPRMLGAAGGAAAAVAVPWLAAKVVEQAGEGALARDAALREAAWTNSFAGGDKGILRESANAIASSAQKTTTFGPLLDKIPIIGSVLISTWEREAEAARRLAESHREVTVAGRQLGQTLAQMSHNPVLGARLSAQAQHDELRMNEARAMMALPEQEFGLNKAETYQEWEARVRRTHPGAWKNFEIAAQQEATFRDTVKPYLIAKARDEERLAVGGILGEGEAAALRTRATSARMAGDWRGEAVLGQAGAGLALHQRHATERGRMLAGLTPGSAAYNEVINSARYKAMLGTQSRELEEFATGSYAAFRAANAPLVSPSGSALDAMGGGVGSGVAPEDMQRQMIDVLNQILRRLDGPLSLESRG